ncbi:MAG: NAD-dependent malic enzyme [Verrucomicrobiae bacterium]|nr:NAD-dependent malic enzyme [Verrucomicrobiae bacterium]
MSASKKKSSRQPASANSKARLSVINTVTFRLQYPNRIGMFAQIVQTFGKEGCELGVVDIVSSDFKEIVRDISIRVRDESHLRQVTEKIRRIRQVKIIRVSDRIFEMHQGGKISIQNKMPLNSREALSMAYTPGVARVCEAIAATPSKVFDYTIKQNAVAVISDGSAVLGLGNIGPEAAMPVMEGKAMLFKQFAGIDAYPICLSTQNTGEIVDTISRMTVGFGGINLEDISAPRCFEIERRLQEILPIPVFHDDQHGTAVVVLAAVVNSLRLMKRTISSLRVVIAGAGAAGVAITRILKNAGVVDIVVCDRKGALHQGRLPNLDASKEWLVRQTNPRNVKGSLENALAGANLFVGVSGPNILGPSGLRRMADKPLVFAMANPTPEIMPEVAAKKAFIVATGRSDYPNQINNVLAFPGIFRGAFQARARVITEGMKLAAAYAIANCVPPNELKPGCIIPSVFNEQVVQKVAAAVAKEAVKAGVCRPAGKN